MSLAARCPLPTLAFACVLALPAFSAPAAFEFYDRGPYLHDGRAETVDAAVRAHDGEAKIPRDRYLRLSPAQRQQLLDFLNSI